MATAMVIWVRRRHHAERSGRFRLSPGDVVFRSTPVLREGCATCGVFDAFFCSAPVCRTRRVTRGYSCAVFCIVPMYRCPACRQFGSTWVQVPGPLRAVTKFGCTSRLRGLCALFRERCSTCGHLSGVLCFAHKVRHASLSDGILTSVASVS